jgi:hypothetical protein
VIGEERQGGDWAWRWRRRELGGAAAAARAGRRSQRRARDWARSGIGLGFHGGAAFYTAAVKKKWTVEIHCETRSDGP